MAGTHENEQRKQRHNCMQCVLTCSTQMSATNTEYLQQRKLLDAHVDSNKHYRRISDE